MTSVHDINQWHWNGGLCSELSLNLRDSTGWWNFIFQPSKLHSITIEANDSVDGSEIRLTTWQGCIKTLQMVGYLLYQLVQEFFHQQYLSGNPSWNNPSACQGSDKYEPILPRKTPCWRIWNPCHSRFCKITFNLGFFPSLEIMPPNIQYMNFLAQMILLLRPTWKK